MTGLDLKILYDEEFGDAHPMSEAEFKTYIAKLMATHKSLFGMTVQSEAFQTESGKVHKLVRLPEYVGTVSGVEYPDGTTLFNTTAILRVIPGQDYPKYVIRGNVMYLPSDAHSTVNILFVPNLLDLDLLLIDTESLGQEAIKYGILFYFLSFKHRIMRVGDTQTVLYAKTEFYRLLQELKNLKKTVGMRYTLNLD